MGGRALMESVPVHPGEVIEELIESLGLTRQQFADHLHVTQQTIQLILARKQSVTPEMAMRLGRAFDNNPRMWLDMHTGYDLAVLAQSPEKQFNEIRPLSQVA